MSRVVGVCGLCAAALGSMEIMLLTGMIDMAQFAVAVPVVLLALWAEGDWSTPQDRLQRAEVRTGRHG